MPRRPPRPKRGDRIQADHIQVGYDAWEAIDGLRFAPPLLKKGNTLALVAVRQAAIFRTKAGGIPAMTGAEPGKASCDLYRFDPIEEELVDTDADEDVYNMANDAIDELSYIQCKRIDGAWFVDVAPCDA